MGYKQYDYRCSYCPHQEKNKIVSDEEKDELLCPACGNIFIRRMSTPLLAMSQEKRDQSLRKRSRDDNKKHQQDRVAEALERVDKGKNRSGGIFSPEFQAAASERKKRRKNS